MNHLHRHITPPAESKDSSVKIALFLMLIALVILIANASTFDKKQVNIAVTMGQVSQQQKANFVERLRRDVTKANRKIKYQQALLEKLNQRLASQSFHSNSDLKKLRRLYNEYGISAKISASNYDSNLAELRLRMLTIDSSVVIAMAALESNWGRSKKSKGLRNYFIKTCSKLLCPLLANSTSQITNGSQSPTKFNDLSDSIKMLIHLINTNDRFQVFRNTRAGFQRRAKLYSAKQIIGTLKYAEIYTEDELQALDKLLDNPL